MTYRELLDTLRFIGEALASTVEHPGDRERLIVLEASQSLLVRGLELVAKDIVELDKHVTQ